MFSGSDLQGSFFEASQPPDLKVVVRRLLC